MDITFSLCECLHMLRAIVFLQGYYTIINPSSIRVVQCARGPTSYTSPNPSHTSSYNSLRHAFDDVRVVQ